MPQLRQPSKTAKIIFPVVVTLVVALIIPSAASLVGMLMFGNLLKESGACDRLVDTAQNALMNIVTIFLGISVGATTTASNVCNWDFIKVMGLGVVAFSLGTISGLLLAKLMNLLTGGKVNPLIGSAGVSAVPMAARISQKVGAQTDPTNFLLMHAMGPNVAGVIGSAVAAGVLLSVVKEGTCLHKMPRRLFGIFAPSLRTRSLQDTKYCCGSCPLRRRKSARRSAHVPCGSMF